MCDFSLQSVRSRAAKVGDKLVTKDFGTGTHGFADPNDPDCAVCVQPGTEIAFADAIRFVSPAIFGRGAKSKHATAIFRQINKDKAAAHHDALELPDGAQYLLTLLAEGQNATVLQLPAAPKTPEEAKERSGSSTPFDRTGNFF